MNIFEDLFFCVAGVYTFMSLWNTLVVSFLKTFEIKKIKNSNLHCLWNPLQSFLIASTALNFPYHKFCYFYYHKNLQNSCLIFNFVC